MGTFDYHHYEKNKELIFPKYKKNKFIDEQMAYNLDGDRKWDNIWGRDFNTCCKTINNTLWT